MTTKAATPTHSAPVALLAGGALAGLLDIVFATSFWTLKGASPLTTPQSIAAGLLGNQAFRGGVPTALLGLLLHFGIALAMAVAYWLASRRLPLLVRRPLACGALYGVLLYLFMNRVVLPLSAAPQSPFSLDWWFVGSIFSHCVLVGIPIALAARVAARAATNGA
jgi:hypothetical protein